jgi:ATP-dependent DNA helicase RecQ
LQKTSEKVAQHLRGHGMDAMAYHAGMENADRMAVQEAFMASDSKIIVATIAFGMGVDKADIRSIYHYNLPKGVESYAQEVGRAGRDGNKSVCEMFVSLEDTMVLENFVLGDTPDMESIASFLEEIFGGEEHMLLSPPALANRHDIRELVIRTLLTYLELDGYLRGLGHIYTSYTLLPNRTSAEMLAPFDETRREFLRKVLARCKKKRNGSFSLDVEEVSQAIGEPRERIVAALEYLEGKGDLDLKASGTRQRFRVLRRPALLEGLARELCVRFAERESRELERIRQMLVLAGDPECLTMRLLGYFGENRGPCGHCGPCLGQAPCVPEPFAPRKPGGKSLAKLDALARENLPQLSTPRRLAKFLCGLGSPATSRLKDHEAFGLFEQTPFRMVLEMAERALKGVASAPGNVIAE